MSFSDRAYSEKRDFIRMTISAPLSATLSADHGVIAGQLDTTNTHTETPI